MTLLKHKIILTIYEIEKVIQFQIKLAIPPKSFFGGVPLGHLRLFEGTETGFWIKGVTFSY